MFFENFVFSASTKSIGIVALSSLLVACGGGSGGGGASGQSAASQIMVEESTDLAEVGRQVSIQGGAIKGVIENGIVRVFPVESEAGLYRKAALPIGEAGRTDENGEFDVSIPADSVDAVVVEITADAYTRMTCDVVEGCGQDESGDTIAFGEKFSLTEDFVMEAAFSGVQGKQDLTLYVTPLTHLAVSYAAAQTDGLSSDNISTAYSRVEETLNLTGGSLQLPPPDLTKLDAYESLTGDELQYAVMSASFLALVNTPDWSSVAEVINSAEERFTQSGALPDENGGAVSEVTLDDLFYQASDIAGGLQVRTESEAVIVELISVESSTEMYYQEVSSLYQDEPSTGGGSSALEEAVVESEQAVVDIVDEVAVDTDTAMTEEVVAEIVGSDNSVEVVSVVSPKDIVVETSEVVAAEETTEEIADSVVEEVAQTVAEEVVEEAPAAVEPVQMLTIKAHPGSTVVDVHESAVLRVTAEGEGTLLYQWRKDGVDISGANGSALLMDNVQISDAGVYDVIVTDNTGRMPSLAATLTVEPVAHDAQLSWSIPDRRQDGSELLVSDISGYVLAYGTASGDLSAQVTISDAQTTNYLFENLLSATTYYFKIATIDRNGVQGEYSEVVEKSFM